MNENIDLDPLNIYLSDYQSSYINLSQAPSASDNVQHQYNISKFENISHPLDSTSSNNMLDSIKSECNTTNSVNDSNKNVTANQISVNNFSASNLQNNDTFNNYSLPLRKGRCKVKKERSSYWSEKITEKDFPFYGCAVCNICYVDLPDLDKHIATHKDRITSYDLKVKNQLKRKRLKKEKKKLKKLDKKIKKEKNFDVMIEIKPEDGYIGNETASEFNNKDQSLESNEVGSGINDNETLANIKSKLGNSELDRSKSADNVSNETSEINKDNSNPESNSNDKTVNKDNKPLDKLPNNISQKEGKDGEVNKDLFNLQRIFKCFACQKQFTLSYYLKLHVRSHTDEKPYTCPKCGQSFITASKLGRHDKRFHLMIKYQCRICFRYFSRFEFLTKHFDRKHADDKIEGEPYDYNAILPYLKELEEQLKEKSEQEKKPKEIWTDGWSGPTFNDQTVEDNKTDVKDSMDWSDQKIGNFLAVESGSKDHYGTEYGHSDFDIKYENESPDYPLVKPLEVLVEAKPAETKVEVHVKAETETEMDRSVMDDGDDAPVKNESSDEEYFPENTWVETKLEEPAPPPPSDPLTCRVCSKRISSASYMKIHMRTHTGERPYRCYVCHAGFITSSKMHRHVTTVHHGDATDIKKEPKCTRRSAKLDSENNEGTEKEQMNGEEDGVEDDDVKTESDSEEESKVKAKKTKGKNSKKLKKGKISEKKKNRKRPHACEFCGQRFMHLETLQVHKKSHDGEPLTYKCKFCLDELGDEASLRSHEASHSGPKPYLCTICGKGYKKKETMVYHRKHHKPDSVFICTLCSKAFNAKSKLQRHLVTHRREKYSLKYECPVCAHMFHTKYHVQMHLATHQREGLIVEQNRNEILAMVLQNARKIPKPNAEGIPDSLPPTDERSRVCNICGEVFQHFFYLEEHLKNHGTKLSLDEEEAPEVKKHVCQVCNKSFKLHYYLKLHSFTHTKEKPYICQECGKGFITKGKLKRHLETHAGLKKYQCHVCYKFFTRPSYLRTHVRTIHGTQDYNFRLSQNLSLNYPSSQNQ